MYKSCYHNQPLVAKTYLIPNALKSIPQWVLGHIERQPDGTTRKPPISPLSLKKCNRLDNKSWCSYSGALTALENVYGGDDRWGIGFVFTHDLGLTFLDLDGARDSATGALRPWAKRLVRRLHSYTEVSRSGRGLHIVCIGRKPGGECRYNLRHRPGQRVEIYDSGQYLWMTGHHLDGTPTTIEPRQDEIESLYRTIWPEPPP